MLKPQSIRKGVTIFINNKEMVEKQEILDLSKDWNVGQEIYFKKMLQQGGERKFNNSLIRVIPKDVMVTSKGEKDTGIIVAPGADTRF